MLPKASYAPTETVYGTFNTFDPATGAPITLAGTPSLRLELTRAGVWTEITGAGITLRVDEDDVGRHEYEIDLDNANIVAAAGDEFNVAINVGTVDGNSAVGIGVDRLSVAAAGLTTQQKADVNEQVDLAVAGLATAAALTVVDNEVGTLLTRATEARLAELDAANIPTDLATIAGYIDTEIQAIIDALAVVDANVDLVLADTGTDGVALTVAERAAIADAILGRNIAGGSSTGRTVTSALRRIRNRVAIAAGTMTVYQEDDATADHTAAVTTTAGNPISEVDPA